MLRVFTQGTNCFHSEILSLESLKKNGIEWVQDLGRKNVEDLLTVIQWNEDNVNAFTNGHTAPC